MPRRPPPSREPAPPSIRSPTVSWFPPHMYRAYKRLAKEITNIDVVLELRDARLPAASGNPELAQLIGGRKRILLLNKTQLASPASIDAWKTYFQKKGQPALFIDADTGSGINLIYPLIQELVHATQENLRRRGIRPPQQRLMIAGIPNVGKSTLINRMIRRKRLRTAPSPGVTKSVEWVEVKNKYLLMDTPGLVLPRLDDPREATMLGWIGTIPDGVMGIEKLAAALLPFAAKQVPHKLKELYHLENPDPEAGGEAMLHLIATGRGFLIKGGEADTQRVGAQVLQDFRAGRLGRITLEEPPAR